LGILARITRIMVMMENLQLLGVWFGWRFMMPEAVLRGSALAQALKAHRDMFTAAPSGMTSRLSKVRMQQQ
jgi:hypothetical protein